LPHRKDMRHLDRLWTDAFVRCFGSAQTVADTDSHREILKRYCKIKAER
jgi:hypothetical protein